MEERINKLVPIVVTGIAFETVVFALYLFMRHLSPFILLSFFATYILMLFFAKQSDIFDKTSFPQALLYALLIAAPVILLPSVIGLFGQSIITRQVPSMASINWIPLVLYQNKY